MANFHDLDIKLLVCDFGGVLRDSSAGLDHGYALGFQTEGIPYRYDHQHTWHLRGVGKYDIAIECVKALLALAIRSEEHRLQHILDRADAECVLDEIVGDTLDLRAQAVAERIRLTYKMFFNSPEAATWVNLYPNVREDIQRIAAKGHQIALLTNGNRMTVTRDLPFSEYFDLIISEDEMTAKKPAGDGLTLIMKELNMSPAQTAFCLRLGRGHSSRKGSAGSFSRAAERNGFAASPGSGAPRRHCVRPRNAGRLHSPGTPRRQRPAEFHSRMRKRARADTTEVRFCNSVRRKRSPYPFVYFGLDPQSADSRRRETADFICP